MPGRLTRRSITPPSMYEMAMLSRFVALSLSLTPKGNHCCSFSSRLSFTSSLSGHRLASQTTGFWTSGSWLAVMASTSTTPRRQTAVRHLCRSVQQATVRTRQACSAVGAHLSQGSRPELRSIPQACTWRLASSRRMTGLRSFSTALASRSRMSQARFPRRGVRTVASASSASASTALSAWRLKRVAAAQVRVRTSPR